VVVYGFCRRAVWCVAGTTVTGNRARDPRSAVVAKTIVTANLYNRHIITPRRTYYMIYDVVYTRYL